MHLRHFASFAAAAPLFAGPGGPTGSRFVRPHGPAALYAAFDADTAHREGNQTYYQTAATPAGQALAVAGALRPDPVVLVGAHVRASRLLDRRDPFTRLQLGILTVMEILAPWKAVPNAPTQVLGDAVFNDGHFEGILYPPYKTPAMTVSSFSPPGVCPPRASISSTRSPASPPTYLSSATSFRRVRLLGEEALRPCSQ